MTFKILSATFLQDSKHSFTLDFTQPESNSQDCEFTLLIGKNGVSKSLILVLWTARLAISGNSILLSMLRSHH